MEKIKVAKKIPFLVSINYKLKEETIEQIFSFNTTNKKYLKYAYDQRFCLKNKIEKTIEDNLLSRNSFLGREEEESKITMIYRNDFGVFDNSSKIINCEFYLPPFNGCKYCANCEIQNNFLFCKKKKKHYEINGIKTCPVFNSINEIIS